MVTQREVSFIADFKTEYAYVDMQSISY